MVKNLPAMQEAQVRSLGGEDPSPLQDSCLENPMDREAWRATVREVAKSQAQLSHQPSTVPALRKGRMSVTQVLNCVPPKLVCPSTQNPSMWLHVETGSLKRYLSYTEVTRLSPIQYDWCPSKTVVK